jgi:uncharacterized protein YdaU (DUF1376 family)
MAKVFDKQWYPFYHDLFNRSTAGWGAERVGAYILLLNHQWQNSGIPKDRSELLYIAKCSDDILDKVLLKFEVEKNGKLFNKKMENIRKEQIDKYEKRANAGKAGGIAKYQNLSNAKAMVEQSSSKTLPLKNKNKSIINNTERAAFTKPTWNEVGNFIFKHVLEKDINPDKLKVQAEANSFVDYYESKGWLVGKSPMRNWQAAARRWVIDKDVKAEVVQQRKFLGED